MTHVTFKYYNFYTNSLDLNNDNIIGNYALKIDVNPKSGDPDLQIANTMDG